MEIFGIGPLELLFIILLALLILGPKDMVRIGKNIGQGLYKIVKSDTWKTVRQVSEKVRTLPNELMREAGIEEMNQSINSGVLQPLKNAQKSLDSLKSETLIAGSKNPGIESTEASSDDPNKILPPAPDKEQSG
jgi:Sec-independent protein translocase protein TatA